MDAVLCSEQRPSWFGKKDAFVRWKWNEHPSPIALGFIPDKH
jgi:hypothetical protein